MEERGGEGSRWRKRKEEKTGGGSGKNVVDRWIDWEARGRGTGRK